MVGRSALVAKGRVIRTLVRANAYGSIPRLSLTAN